MISNALNYGLIGGATGLLFDLINQRGSMQFSKAFDVAVSIGTLGYLLGALVDESHEEEWQCNNKKENLKIRVWRKGSSLLLHNPYEVRRDKYGNIMNFSQYGNRASKLGWEIDHSKPKSKGGHPNHINNLQPLNCLENVRKSNIYPYCLK